MALLEELNSRENIPDEDQWLPTWMDWRCRSVGVAPIT
jgi:hypothetical protein